MRIKSSLLGAAIVSVLAISAPALASPPDQSPAAARAKGLIDSNPGALKRAAADGFTVRDSIVDADGTEHVRFDRSYRGLPMIGGDVVVHSNNGKFISASQTLKTTGRPALNGNLTADQAIVEAGVAFGTGFEGVPSASQVIYARGKSPVLAFDVRMSGMKADQTPTEMHYIVDAGNGLILDEWDMVHTAKPGGGSICTGTTSATGTGRTLYAGNVAINTTSCGTGFQMKDQTRGGGYTTDMAGSTRGSGTIFSDADNTWGNNSNSDAASAAADAHFGIAETWDYYKNVHGRNGIANNGVGALSKVHYGRNYVNAYWSDSCFCMTFGDGDGVTYSPLVDLDVAGHEMSHGVMSRTANLTYSGESGGLNEANSDIMGAMVEFYAANASDVPDYLIGEEIYIANVPGSPNQTALRYMYNPIKDTRSPNCYASTLGSLDVHYSSGVANHFFYLLAEGSGAKTFNGVDHTSPTCDGSTLAGIGRSAAERIWYKAVTTYMTSSTNYAGARAATLSAATALYGAGSAQYNAVAATWSAVSVN